MERLADPTILETMSLTEKLSHSLMVMLIGAGVVFIVLIVLMLSIRILSGLFYKRTD